MPELDFAQSHISGATRAMVTMQDIKNAIGKLMPEEREDIAVWLQQQSDAAYRIAEPAAAYNAQRETISIEEYLESEVSSNIRHEYVDGVLYAMSGASERHCLINGNIHAAFHGHLRGTSCTPFMSDYKLRLEIDRADIFYYPDLAVSCVREGVDSHFHRYPKLIVEVLSPSTERIDRQEKRLNYLQLRTLEEYVLVSQNTFEIASYRRAEHWAQHLTIGPDALMDFRSIGLTLPMAQIYEGVMERT